MRSSKLTQLFEVKKRQVFTKARGVFNVSGFADKLEGRRVCQEFILKEAAAISFKT